MAGRIAPLPYSSTLSSFPAIAPRPTPCHAPPTGLASTPAALPRRSRRLNGQPAAVNLGVRRGTGYSQLLEIAAWPPLQVVHERWHCFIARALLFFCSSADSSAPFFSTLAVFKPFSFLCHSPCIPSLVSARLTRILGIRSIPIGARPDHPFSLALGSTSPRCYRRSAST